MKINEIFYSLQGEGHFAGTPAVFVRFSGCNLACGFCDTDHRRGEEWGEEAVVAEVLRHPARHVVLTGGEPALQATASLVDKLHRAGCYVQMETNGTCAAAAEVGVDWITCSPKDAPVRLARIDELKVVFLGQDLGFCSRLPRAKVYCLQPCDTKDAAGNAEITRETIEYVKSHPQWKLSLQTHKLLGFR